MANAAFYFGLVRTLAEDDRPLWSRMSFSAAEENFHVAAQHGIDARVYWPGMGEVRRHRAGAAPAAADGPRGPGRWGVEPDEATGCSAIIEQRCVLARNGATWYVDTVTAHEERRHRPAEALRLTLQDYRELMHANEPVHTWPI